MGFLTFDIDVELQVLDPSLRGIFSIVSVDSFAPSLLAPK